MRINAKTETITFRLSAGEKEQMFRQAEERGCNVTEYILSLVKKDAKKQEKVVKVY